MVSCSQDGSNTLVNPHLELLRFAGRFSIGVVIIIFIPDVARNDVKLIRSHAAQANGYGAVAKISYNQLCRLAFFCFTRMPTEENSLNPSVRGWVEHARRAATRGWRRYLAVAAVGLNLQVKSERHTCVARCAIRAWRASRCASVHASGACSASSRGIA